MTFRVAVAPEPPLEGVFADRMSGLAEMTRSVAAAEDPAMVLDDLLETVKTCLGAEDATAVVWEEGPGGMVWRTGEGGIEIEAGDSRLESWVDEMSVRSSPDPLQSGLAAQGLAAGPENGWGVAPRSMIWAPMRCGGQTVGAIGALNAVSEDGFGDVDNDFLRATADMLALAIVGARKGRLLVEMDKTRQELQLAATIQRNLLPTTDPLRSPVQGLNRPAREVSGDFFDYLILSDGRFPFALGDVSGKGMNAALLMSKTVSLFRCLAKSIDEPAELLSILNREICETAARGMFVTMVAGVYDSISGRVRFANAGHEPPLHRHPDRSYRTFPADAPPLGIVEPFEVTTTEIDLVGGEFYIFSDGLTEFAYGENETLGVTGLIQMVEASTGTRLADRLETVLAALDSDGWEARDDLTVLTIDGSWIPRHG